MRFVDDGEPWSAVRLREEIRSMTSAYEQHGYGVWPVLFKETGVIVGACGLRQFADTSQIELIWVFARAHWGQGYAFEAATAVLDFGLREIPQKRAIATADREDARSIRLINRLGMRYEGIVRAYRRDLMQYVVETT